MPKKLGNLRVELLTGVAAGKNLIYVALTDSQLVRQNIAHSFIVSNLNGRWRECGRTYWKCVGMTLVPSGSSHALLAISEDGDVFHFANGVRSDEAIRPQPIVLRGLATVDGQAIAYGMRRQAYLRIRNGRWTPMHGPDIDEDNEDETAGFEGLCGFSLRDLYAVGWEGEIWHFDGRSWQMEDSPVDIILTDATVHSDGMVYACGQNGTLVRGRKGQWDVVAEDSTVDDFWSVASFNGQIWVTSFGALYRLDGDDLVIMEPGVKCDTYQKLSVAEDLLWSLGTLDFVATDSVQWTKVF